MLKSLRTSVPPPSDSALGLPLPTTFPHVPHPARLRFHIQYTHLSLPRSLPRSGFLSQHGNEGDEETGEGLRQTMRLRYRLQRRVQTAIDYLNLFMFIKLLS